MWQAFPKDTRLRSGYSDIGAFHEAEDVIYTDSVVRGVMPLVRSDVVVRFGSFQSNQSSIIFY